MTVALDVETRWPASGQESTSGDRSFTHAATGSAKGAVVFVGHEATSAPCTGVTYGGRTMSYVEDQTDTSESGRVQIWYLGDLRGITGSQTVVLQGMGAIEHWAVCWTVTAATDIVVEGSHAGTFVSSGANPSVSLSTWAAGMAFGGLHGGAAAPTSYVAGTNYTQGPGADLGTLSQATQRRTAETAAGTYPFNFSFATADDYAILCLNFAEAQAAATDVIRLSLAAADTPETRTAHIVRVRARVNTVTYFAPRLWVALYEGSTNRSGDLESAAELTTSFANYSFVIADADAANISSYADLELRVWGESMGGFAGPNYEIAQVSLSIPAAVSGIEKAGRGVSARTARAATAGISVESGRGVSTRTGRGAGATVQAETGRGIAVRSARGSKQVIGGVITKAGRGTSPRVGRGHDRPVIPWTGSGTTTRVSSEAGLNAAIAAASAGDTIEIANGTYTLAAQVNVTKAGIRIKAESWLGVILQGTASVPTTANQVLAHTTFGFNVTADNVYVEDILFRYFGVGLYFDGVDNPVANGCTLVSNFDGGLTFWDCNSPRARACRCMDPDLSGDTSGTITAAGSVTDAQQDYGIDVYGCTNPDVSWCYFFGHFNQALAFKEGNQNPTARFNTFEGSLQTSLFFGQNIPHNGPYSNTGLPDGDDFGTLTAEYNVFRPVRDGARIYRLNFAIRAWHVDGDVVLRGNVVEAAISGIAMEGQEGASVGYAAGTALIERNTVGGSWKNESGTTIDIASRGVSLYRGVTSVIALRNNALVYFIDAGSELTVCYDPGNLGACPKYGETADTTLAPPYPGQALRTYTPTFYPDRSYDAVPATPSGLSQKFGRGVSARVGRGAKQTGAGVVKTGRGTAARSARASDAVQYAEAGRGTSARAVAASDAVIRVETGPGTSPRTASGAKFVAGGAVKTGRGTSGRTATSATPRTTDTFTDVAATALESHLSDAGLTWVEHASYAAGAHAISSEGRIRCPTAIACHYLSYIPASVNYVVEADFVVKSLIGVPAIAARIASGGNTMYRVQYNVAAGQWELVMLSGGSPTNLAVFAATLNVAQTYHVRLECFTWAKNAYVDGVLILTSTDNTINAINRGGIRSGGTSADATGIHIDNFVVEDTALSTSMVYVESGRGASARAARGSEVREGGAVKTGRGVAALTARGDALITWPELGRAITEHRGSGGRQVTSGGAQYVKAGVGMIGP